MDRRDNLKVLLSGTIATGFLLSTGCNTEHTQKAEEILSSSGYGRVPEEMDHDKKMMAENFFTPKEKETVTLLSDIIIPKDETSCSASEAGVPDFIEFMMKDYPKFQVPMRGGIMWLENLALATYGKTFGQIKQEEQISLVDRIAYPDTAEENMKFGVKFFNLVRNLTCTGFFTSKEGIKDIGYVGNRPNQWDGVPDEVLKKYGLSYDERTIEVCLKIDQQQNIARWDANGNLIG